MASDSCAAQSQLGDLRVVFDPSDPTTIRATNFVNIVPADVMAVLNAARPLVEPFDDKTIDEALRQLFMGTARAMVFLRQGHLGALVGRTPMFAEDDAAAWARPTIGLKRTFSPRFTQLVVDE
ncbi:small capsid protein [Equid alphaherpesvirus 3]|uniref:Small capsomere-interacting protein n=1 Tax=Equid alphaherpesvirus 3 TaxID=80341 RepID=A0A077B9B3_9ALPH|nr:small capsid protein [Equid alphaherpesvirus 3]AIL02942.1 small capsid protein [Equid alphaherpesvirus 3]